MTTKRFYEINSQILGLTTIQDKNKRYTFPPLQTEKNHMFLKALNELVTECNSLKKENAELKQKIISLEDARYSYKQDWKQASADCELYKDEIKFLKDENKGLIKENEQLKSELQRIYDIATVNKVKNIVEEVYDDLLYETSEKSDYAREMLLKCLEKIERFGDDLE